MPESSPVVELKVRPTRVGSGAIEKLVIVLPVETMLTGFNAMPTVLVSTLAVSVKSGAALPEA